MRKASMNFITEENMKKKGKEVRRFTASMTEDDFQKLRLWAFKNNMKVAPAAGKLIIKGLEK